MSPFIDTDGTIILWGYKNVLDSIEMSDNKEDRSMNRHDIQLELLNEENIEEVRAIHREDISEDFVIRSLVFVQLLWAATRTMIKLRGSI